MIWYFWGGLFINQEMCGQNLVLFLFQSSAAGGGMTSNIASLSRSNIGNKGTVGGMGGGYAGATDMVNNGLSPSQNQVRLTFTQNTK